MQKLSQIKEAKKIAIRNITLTYYMYFLDYPLGPWQSRTLTLQQLHAVQLTSLMAQLPKPLPQRRALRPCTWCVLDLRRERRWCCKPNHPDSPGSGEVGQGSVVPRSISWCSPTRQKSRSSNELAVRRKPKLGAFHAVCECNSKVQSAYNAVVLPQQGVPMRFQKVKA